MKDQNKVYIGAGVLVIVLIIIAVVVNNHSQKGGQANYPPVQTLATVTPTPTASPTKAAVKAYNPVAYEQALVKYQERFQFATCREGTPDSIAIRQGLAFMLDNRDSSPHTFSVAGQKYPVRAYDFAIVTAKVLGSYPILCDGKSSVTLNVEK